MTFLIDGHNLISVLPDISLDEEHDEAKLVEKLKGYCGRVRKRAVVIFDHGMPGGQSFDLSTGQIKVVFAAAHRTNADTLIKQRIRKASKNQYTVITSDHEIQDVAQRFRVPYITSADFAAKMSQTTLPPAPEEDPIDDDPHLSKNEVDEWLRLFGAQGD